MGSRGRAPRPVATTFKTPGTPSPSKEEAGQSMVLIIGMIAISLLAISVVLAATAVNVQAHKLLSVADGAVAAAADNFELTAGGEDIASLRLQPSEVRNAAEKYLADINARAGFSNLHIVSAGVESDGVTAHVRLGAVVHPPIIGWVVPRGVSIHVDSHARTLLSR
jgi:hypothetical protein